MDSILVLTDFTAASFHAARYAAALTQQYHSRELILYHAYDIIVPTSEMPDVTESNRILYEESVAGLAALYSALKDFIYGGTAIRCRAEAGDLADSINSVAGEEGASLVVMGLTGKSRLERLLSGNDTFAVSDESNYPVLLVPEKAEIKPVERIVFAWDGEKTTASIPAVAVRKVLDELHALLFVVNVGDGTTEIPDLQGLLAGYHPSYHHLPDKDVENGIKGFAQQHNASLILTIRKSRGFFQELFHHSVTQHLTQEATIPLLVLHEG